MDKKTAVLLHKIDEKLAALLRDLKNYSDAKLNEQPSESSWSVLQIMQHLMGAEKGALAYVQKKLSFNPELEKANVLSGLRSTFLNLSLAAPFKIQAPAAVSGDFLRTDLTFWEVAKQWKSQRKALALYLEELPEEFFEKELYKHPLTGKMSLAGMLSFFSTHMDRHTRQIRRTLKKVDAVKQL
ncbi:MAG: DinB family protein, partial [Bacteroidota bacterium]